MPLLLLQVFFFFFFVCMCVCVRARACVRACVCMCARVYVVFDIHKHQTLIIEELVPSIMPLSRKKEVGGGGGGGGGLGGGGGGRRRKGIIMRLGRVSIKGGENSFSTKKGRRARARRTGNYVKSVTYGMCSLGRFAGASRCSTCTW